jgi:AraC-like DNA-binding protein
MKTKAQNAIQAEVFKAAGEKSSDNDPDFSSEFQQVMGISYRVARLAPLLMMARTNINFAAFDFYPPLQRLKSHLSEKISAPLSLCEAAQIAHLEPTYFCRLFHERVGVTFRYWLGLRRVDQATNLMERADSPLIQVAADSGFPDFRTFERTFKKHTGLTPREFKALVRP